MKNKLSIATTTGSYSAYLAVPRVQKGPGLLVLPEIYNSNHHIRSVADQFANAGFLALAPDVFWRIRSDCYLPYTADGLQNAREMNQKLDVNQLINDLGVALETLGNHERCSGLVGSVGFCLGGKLSFLCAARLEVQAAVSYYGVNIENYLEEADQVTCPMLLHFAGNDPRVPAKARRRIEERMSKKPNVQIHLYEDAEHGFNRLGYPPYHETAAKLAWERTTALFSDYLG